LVSYPSIRFVGLLAMYLVFFFLYVGLAAVHVYVVIKLRSIEHYHAVWSHLVFVFASST